MHDFKHSRSVVNDRLSLDAPIDNYSSKAATFLCVSRNVNAEIPNLNEN